MTTATTTATLRLGTRGSELARTQSQAVADAITAATGTPSSWCTSSPRATGPRRPSRTSVAPVCSSPRSAGHCSRAPSTSPCTATRTCPPPPSRLIIAAVPGRQDPRDALVARDGLTLGELPPGSKVGTGAPRRVAQIRALGLGLDVVPIRGNVDTRMGRVVEGDLDAVVLARAGLARLGRLDAITETLDPLQVLPAPAQGALAVECRTSDARARDQVVAQRPHRRRLERNDALTPGLAGAAHPLVPSSTHSRSKATSSLTRTPVE